jgi:hypothetical protein
MPEGMQGTPGFSASDDRSIDGSQLPTNVVPDEVLESYIEDPKGPERVAQVAGERYDALTAPDRLRAEAQIASKEDACARASAQLKKLDSQLQRLPPMIAVPRTERHGAPEKLVTAPLSLRERTELATKTTMAVLVAAIMVSTLFSYTQTADIPFYREPEGKVFAFLLALVPLSLVPGIASLPRMWRQRQFFEAILATCACFIAGPIWAWQFSNAVFGKGGAAGPQVSGLNAPQLTYDNPLTPLLGQSQLLLEVLLLAASWGGILLLLSKRSEVAEENPAYRRCQQEIATGEAQLDAHTLELARCRGVLETIKGGRSFAIEASLARLNALARFTSADLSEVRANPRRPDTAARMKGRKA